MWWQGQRCLPRSWIQLLFLWSVCNRIITSGSTLERQAIQEKCCVYFFMCSIKLTGSGLTVFWFGQQGSTVSLNMTTLTRKWSGWSDGNLTWNSAHVKGPSRNNCTQNFSCWYVIWGCWKIDRRLDAQVKVTCHSRSQQHTLWWHEAVCNMLHQPVLLSRCTEISAAFSVCLFILHA